ncbi:MAG TPA: acyltransferase [Bacteroidia bacterium]|jgi:peptidoglycan/LPS O-acetylase OafA/YrhL
MAESNKVFFPNLEGLRFFAFFAVFINHAVVCLGYHSHSSEFEFARTNFLKNGDLGVSFFFVLSGFLITYLLLKEKELNGKINILNFYLRRVLRIWPLYFLIVGLCLFVFPTLDNSLPKWFPFGVSTSEINPWLYATFTGNFDYLFNGINNVLIGILWSVSIEEQFYLFWPLIIAFIPAKHLIKVFIVIILGSIAFRFFYAHGNIMTIKYHSLSCVSDLATGALIAALAFKGKVVAWFGRLPKYSIGLVYLILLILVPLRIYIWKFGVHYNHASAIAPVIFSSLFAFVIMEQNYAKKSFYKISNFKLISSWGKFTYGMYCYHMISFLVVLILFHLMGINLNGMSKYTYLFILLLSLCSTIFVAELSYYYFESIFLRMKERLSFIKKE